MEAHARGGITHKIPRAWEYEGETRGRSARIVRNQEERNVGTKGKSFKQDLTSAKDLNVVLLRVATALGHGSDYSLISSP